MKLSVAIVLLSVISAIYGDQNEKETLQKCFKKYGITFDPTSENLSKYAAENEGMQKCVLACYLQKVKVMREDGSFDIDRIVSISFEGPENQEAELKKIAETCVKRVGKDQCDAAHMLQKCMQDSTEKLQRGSFSS